MGTDFRKIANKRRLDVLEMVNRAGTGHIGGSMSCMDILVSLYYNRMDVDKIRAGKTDRDRFILSKGHCGEALYAVLADLGFIPKKELATYAQFGTRLAEHPTAKIPGVETATGALGHGLSLGVGMALGNKLSGIVASVYVLMGDGEQAEGSIWEAAMAASKYQLENLVAIIDRNRLQISGDTEDVMPLEDLRARYKSFGWGVTECNGHDPDELQHALSARYSGKPALVIANTIKGYGSSIMENKADWHHLVPNAEQYEQIKAEFLSACGEA